MSDTETTVLGTVYVEQTGDNGCLTFSVSSEFQAFSNKKKLFYFKAIQKLFKDHVKRIKLLQDEIKTVKDRDHD